MASSIASFVPEPIEKCAVCAASPISTRLPWCQRLQSTRWKLSQAEPRRWAALLMSRWPSRYFANSFSQKAIDCSWFAASRPCARQVSSRVSTITVESDVLNW